MSDFDRDRAYDRIDYLGELIAEAREELEELETMITRRGPDESVYDDIDFTKEYICVLKSYQHDLLAEFPEVKHWEEAP